MKRPIAGLLASAAAVPGAWLLASGDERSAAPPLAPEPEGASQPQVVADPAKRLAAIEPAFGQAPAAAVPATEMQPGSQDHFRLPEPAFVPPIEPLPQAERLALPTLPPPDLVAALPAPAVADPEPTSAFVARPVVQPLPAPIAQPASPLPPLQSATVLLAQADTPPPLLTKPTPTPNFVAEPLVQPLPPQPVSLARLELPPQPAAVVRVDLLSVAAEAAVQTEPQASTPAAPQPAPKVIDAPHPAKAMATAAYPVAAKPPPAYVAAPVIQAVPVKLAATEVPKAASAVPPSTPAPVSPPQAKPLAKVLAAAAPKAPVQQPVAIPATIQPAPVRPAEPVAVPRAKLPVGEVVLAAFTPAPIAQEPTPAAPPRRVETTAAKTVPVGAAAQVIYPEPAFGPPEAKFIPAAYSSIEPPEQPTSPGSASTLAQAIAYSYETNPRLLAERASNRAADLGYPAARAAFGPRLDASASLSYTRDRDEVLPGSFLRQQGWSDTASLILSQPLLTFGRSQARVGQAAATIDYRRESLRLVQNEVMLDVIAAYVGTLREAGAVTIARENVALLQRQLEESNARFAVREITLADVQQVETRLALGKTVLLDAQARLGEIQSRFYRAVGMPPGELAPPEPLTLPVTALSDAYGLADTESPLVRAAQARERVSRAFLAGTRAEAAPRVDFRGTADYGSVSEYTRDLRGTRVRGTVTLSVPLFDSGARSAESGQAREANSADLQLIAAAQRDSRTAVATGWNNLLAARMSIDHYRQAVESAQRAYENAQRQERAGMRSTLDVLDLARDLLNVRNAYNAALADEYQSRATLLAAMGQLDPTKMSDGLKLYDPSDHFRRVKGKGDVPLLTGTLSALDGVTLPNLKSTRPSPDAAALVGTAETVTGE